MIKSRFIGIVEKKELLMIGEGREAITARFLCTFIPAKFASIENLPRANSPFGVQLKTMKIAAIAKFSCLLPPNPLPLEPTAGAV